MMNCGSYWEIKIGETTHKLFCGDCIEVMDNLIEEGVKVTLIIADPPYNRGINYGVYRDKMPQEEYFEWCKEWLERCVRILSDDGSLYVFNYPENNAKLLPFIEEKLIFKRWLTWHYPINIGHSKKNYTRSQRSILFCVKSLKYKFNRDDISLPYRNPNDKRIKQRLKKGSRGRAPYDVFCFNIVKNVSREKTEHPCQIPEKLLEIFIRASSDIGDTVLDPFAGSFSTSVVAAKLGRSSIGIDISQEFCEIGKERLSKIASSSLNSFK